MIYVPKTTLTYMGIFRPKNNLILKTNEDTIRTEYVQILYECKEISEQFNVQELCESIRTLLNKVKIFHQSTQSAIEIKQTHYFKDKISLTFSSRGQYLSKNLQIIVNTIHTKESLVVNKKYLFSASVCVATISESYNERVIGTCSQNRRSPKMWTYGRHE